MDHHWNYFYKYCTYNHTSFLYLYPVGLLHLVYTPFLSIYALDTLPLMIVCNHYA